MPEYIVLPENVRTIRQLPYTNRQAPRRFGNGPNGRVGPENNNGYYGNGYYSGGQYSNGYPDDGDYYYQNGNGSAPMRRRNGQRNRNGLQCTNFEDGGFICRPMNGNGERRNRNGSNGSS